MLKSAELCTGPPTQEANVDFHTIAAITLCNRQFTASTSSTASAVDINAAASKYTDVDQAAVTKSH